jgi:hypothetical protein
MANVKYADPTYTDIPPTDDDKVMFRTGAGGDARGSIVQPKGYIDGLKMVWVSGTQVQITPGAAYVPGPKRIAELASAVTLTPTLAANTWYHSYLTVSGSTVGVEAVTTAPAAPYNGTARAKTGDTSRRYIGSFRTNSSAAIMKFACSGDLLVYDLAAGSMELRLVSGSATVATPFSVSAVVPVTASVIRVFLTNAVGGTSLFVGTPANNSFVAIFPGNVSAFDVPFDPADPRMVYRLTGAGTGTVDANGFYIER